MLFNTANKYVTQIIKLNRPITVDINRKTYHVSFHEITSKLVHTFHVQGSYPDWYSHLSEYPLGMYALIKINNTVKVHYLGIDLKQYLVQFLVSNDFFMRGIINPELRYDTPLKSESDIGELITYLNSAFNYKFQYKNNELFFGNNVIAYVTQAKQVIIYLMLFHQLTQYDRLQTCKNWENLYKIKTSKYSMTVKNGDIVKTKHVPKYEMRNHPVTKTLDIFSTDKQLVKSFNTTLNLL